MSNLRIVNAVSTVQIEHFPAVFLAGGITNCPEWQDEVIEKLLKIDKLWGTILNPRRKNFPIHDPNAAQEQIRWEFDALDEAKIFSIWFSDADSDQPICMYELGRHLALHEKEETLHRVAIGVEPGYRREQDVRVQTGLVDLGGEIAISSSLNEHVEKIAELMEYYVRDKGEYR